MPCEVDDGSRGDHPVNPVYSAISITDALRQGHISLLKLTKSSTLLSSGNCANMGAPSFSYVLYIQTKFEAARLKDLLNGQYRSVCRPI